MNTPVRSVLLTSAWLVPALVVIQAALTGQTWFAGAGLTGLHGGVGHAVLLLAVVTAGLAWWARVPRAIPVTLTILLGLIVAQVGLGYSGHRAAVETASALHIPLGVLIVAIATTAATTLTTSLRRSLQDAEH